MAPGSTLNVGYIGKVLIIVTQQSEIMKYTSACEKCKTQKEWSKRIKIPEIRRSLYHQ